jgi:hypothetical protein
MCALGSADPSDRFCLRTLSFGRPTLLLRRSGYDVRGVGKACKCGFNAPFTALFQGHIASPP